jgi:hypothetical protein
MRPVQSKVLPKSISEESVSNSAKADKIVLGNSDDINDDSNTPRTDLTMRWEPHKLKDESGGGDEGGGGSSKDPAVVPHLNIVSNGDRPSSGKPERSLSFINHSSKSEGSHAILDILRQQDVFDIDEQTRLLSEEQEKTKLSRRGNNAFSRTKPLIRQALSCACICSPSAMSLEHMHAVAKTGDLFFDRDGSNFEGQRLSSDVVR